MNERLFLVCLTLSPPLSDQTNDVCTSLKSAVCDFKADFLDKKERRCQLVSCASRAPVSHFLPSALYDPPLHPLITFLFPPHLSKDCSVCSPITPKDRKMQYVICTAQRCCYIHQLKQKGDRVMRDKQMCEVETRPQIPASVDVDDDGGGCRETESLLMCWTTVYRYPTRQQTRKEQEASSQKKCSSQNGEIGIMRQVRRDRGQQFQPKDQRRSMRHFRPFVSARRPLLQNKKRAAPALVTMIVTIATTRRDKGYVILLQRFSAFFILSNKIRRVTSFPL